MFSNVNVVYVNNDINYKKILLNVIKLVIFCTHILHNYCHHLIEIYAQIVSDYIIINFAIVILLEILTWSTHYYTSDWNINNLVIKLLEIFICCWMLFVIRNLIVALCIIPCIRNLLLIRKVNFYFCDIFLYSSCEKPRRD